MTTTVATTTAPPTTVPADPIEAEKREVAERYEAFSVAGNECVAAGTECDLPTVLGEYATPDAALYQLYENRWRNFAEAKQHVEELDQVTRSVVDIQVDDGVAVLTACVIDGAVLVDENREIVDDGVGYRREETFWQQQEGGWRLVGGTTFKLEQAGDATCQF